MGAATSKEIAKDAPLRDMALSETVTMKRGGPARGIPFRDDDATTEGDTSLSTSDIGWSLSISFDLRVPCVVVDVFVDVVVVVVVDVDDVDVVDVVDVGPC